jgi:hypothetical protein
MGRSEMWPGIMQRIGRIGAGSPSQIGTPGAFCNRREAGSRGIKRGSGARNWTAFNGGYRESQTVIANPKRIPAFT